MREIFELARRRCRRAQDGSHEEQNTTKPRNIYRKVAKIHREHTVWSEPVIGKHIEEVEIEPVLLDTVAVTHPLQTHNLLCSGVFGKIFLQISIKYTNQVLTKKKFTSS